MSELTGESVDIAVIGGGPAGLAAAETASAAGARVVVFERMPTVGRKLLMAGKSGLNLTNDAAEFLSAFGESAERLAPMLGQGGATVRQWAADLGQESFTGSSGRVFPTSMKASPLLRAWLARLAERGVEIRTRWRWSGWDGGALAFETPDGSRLVSAKAVILALGGASWPRLGSDASWIEWLGAPLAPFQASNVGAEIAWSDHFRERFAGEPLKNLALTVGDVSKRGECVIAGYGLEGGAVYALSPAIRAALDTGEAVLTVDLAPDRTEAALAAALARPRGKQSTANWLRKATGLTGAKAALLREAPPPPRASPRRPAAAIRVEARSASTPSDSAALAQSPAEMAALIKAAALPVRGLRPIAEAISSAGGVRWDALDDGLMLTGRPGVFCAGEMIDWDAPTGGWLLTACLATGWRAGEAAAISMG